MFEECGFAGCDVVAEDGGGAGERLVGVAIGGGVEVDVDLAARAIGGIGEADVAWVDWLAGFVEREDAQDGQAALAVVGDKEGLEEVDVAEGRVFVLGEEFFPVLAFGGGDRCADQLELLGVAVGADVEEAVAVVDVVFFVVDAFGDAGEGARLALSVERNQASLVVWLPRPRMRNLRSRVRPTPRLKRSSGSWKTSTEGSALPTARRKRRSSRLVCSSSVA